MKFTQNMAILLITTPLMMKYLQLFRYNTEARLRKKKLNKTS